MFRKEFEESMILYPDGRMEKARVEIRYDPLTLQTSRIVQKTPPFGELDEGEDAFCPFCDGVIEKVAARSPVFREGIAWRGEAAIFSNITPYSKYSFVVRLTKDHSPPIEGFKASHFRDALMLIKEAMNLIDEGDHYHFAGINYLRSAGGSVRHPHMQYIASQTPTDYFLRVDEGARKFYRDNGVDYWTWLVDVEKEGERYVGETQGIEWVAAFAPKGFYHLIGVSSERTLAEMDEKNLEGPGEGILRYMGFLKSRNMLHDEAIVYTLPEAFAAELRGFWDEG